MKALKLYETEVIETTGVFEFPDGEVTVSERETHELYRPEQHIETRLVIGDVIDLTRDFIAKARTEFTELNSVMRELTTKSSF